MKYKILFAGIGSIGKRHMMNTRSYLDSLGIEYEIDALRSGKGNEAPCEISETVSRTYSYEDLLPCDYDVAFITNPTALHYDTIKRLAPHTRSMFIEKPVFDSSLYDISLLNLQDCICYVACPLRYNLTLQYIKNEIDLSAAYGARSICSSYLPTWREGIDYRSTYSAHKALGGGVAIDLIHEWDYLSWLFGFPEKVSSIKGKYSNLEIDSDDLAVYIAKNKKMVYELHLDYFGRKSIRQLQIFMPDETIQADINLGEVSFLKENRRLIFSEERNDFQMREIEHFFNIIRGKCANDNDIMEACSVLKLSEGEI